MIPENIAAMRVLLGHEDVIEAAAKVAYYAEKPKPLNAWYEVGEGERRAHKDWVRTEFSTVLELAGALPAAPAAPGWESPAALQQGYDELLERYELAIRVIEKQREVILNDLLSVMPAGPLPEAFEATPAPCRYCTQCGRPLPAQDTADGRRVCRECGKPCPSCCTTHRASGVWCEREPGHRGKHRGELYANDPHESITWANAEPEAGETKGPGIVPAAGGEGL